MAKSQDEYSPVPNIAPQTGSPNDTLSVRSNPASFGAQVGASEEALSGTFDKLATEATGIAIQRQGQINETLATNADSQYAEATGTIYGGYKALKGLDAVAAKEDTVNSILTTRQKIRDSLPSDAVRRAFDLMAVRREGYMVQDINGYAAGQIKQAHTSSLVASAGLALDSTSRPEIAYNDAAFGSALGDMKAQLIGAFTSDAGYSSVTHMDIKTGAITFDNSPQGHDAQAEWTAYYNKYLGKAWENKLDVMAFDPQHGNVQSAVNALETNRDKIPADAYARISAKLAGPYKNAQMGFLAVDAVNQATVSWQNSITTGKPTGPIGTYTPESITADPTSAFGLLLGKPVTITSGLRTPQYNASIPGASPTSEHLTGNAWDFVPQGMSTHDAVVMLAQKLHGFDQIIDEGGHIHVGFGPNARGEVLQGSPGHFTKVDIPIATANIPEVPGGPTGGANYINKSDYIDANMGTILANVFQKAQTQFPDRPDLWDQATRTAETQLTNVIRTERLSIKATGDTILDAAINGTYTHGVPVSDISQLDAIPQLANQWRDYQLQAGQYGVATIQRIIQSNARGRAPTFGTNFYSTLSKVMDGSYSDINQVAGDLDVSVDQKHQPLTNTGFKIIKQIMDTEGKNPTDKTFFTQAYTWMNSPAVRGAITATGSVPGANTPVLDNKFETALMDVLPKLIAGHGQGLTLQQMIDPKSKDYVGGAFDHAKYTMADKLKSLASSVLTSPGDSINPVQTTGFNIGTIKTQDDLFKALTDKKITKQQFGDLAIKLGLARPTPPSIPTPH